MSKIGIFLLVAFLSIGALAIDGKCRALVLSGGGDKGSYQAAVFITFTNLLAQLDIAYDVIGGVSVGALNGSGLGTYLPGNETAAAEWLFGVWNDVTEKDVFTNWPGGILEGLFLKQGVFDNSNLFQFFREKLAGKEILKKISLGVADMDTAKYVSCDYNYTALTDGYVDDVIASTAMPLAFPALLKEGMTLLDGGVVWSLDLLNPIRRCLEVVESEKDIIVDIIMTSETHMRTVEDLKRYSTFDHFRRGQEIKSFFKAMKNLNRTTIAHPDVTFRYILAPSETLTINPLPLDFSKKHLEYCMEVGKRDAEAALKLGEGGYMKLLMEYSQRIQEGEKLHFKDLLQSKLSEVESKVNLSSS